MELSVNKYKDILEKKRPVSGHRKMDIGHRAKQFMPFSALNGLEESVREKETVYVEKSILPEEKMMEIDRILRQSAEGRPVIVTYFTPMKQEGTGMASRMEGGMRRSKTEGKIEVGDREINISDIMDINIM